MFLELEYSDPSKQSIATGAEFFLNIIRIRITGKNVLYLRFVCLTLQTGSHTLQSLPADISSVADPDPKDPHPLAGSGSKSLSTDPDLDLNIAHFKNINNNNKKFAKL